jgi:hypothetical protein
MKNTLGFSSILVITFALSIALAPISGSHSPITIGNGIPIGWTDDINLSNMPEVDKQCQIALNNDSLHIVWRHNTTDVAYSKSINGGNTWTSFISLYHSIDASDYPDIGVYHENIHVVWEDRDGYNSIHYRNSTDNGETWSPEKRISNITGFNARGPLLYVNNSNIHIIWWDQRDGSDGEIYYRRSLDGGTSFDNGQGIDADRRITFSPAMVGNIHLAGFGSNISIIWSDERNGNFDIYWMISRDNGYTWEDGLGNIDQNRRLTNDTSDSMWNSIATDGFKICLIWVDQMWPGPEYRIYFRNSIDNGVTWNPIQLLTGPSPIIASPDIAIRENSTYVIWDDARDDSTTTEIYYKNSSDGGITWSNNSRLTYSMGYDSLWPRIAVNNTTKHVVWYDNRDGNSEIYYKRSPDFPDTSPPTHSNETPQPDSFKDPPGTDVSVWVTDPSGVNASSIQLYVNGSLVAFNLTPITNGYNVSYVSSGFSPGVISCRIVADDNCSNHLDYTWNFTVLYSFRIPVVAGWNLISMPLIPPSTSLPNALLDKDSDTLWDRMQYCDPYDAANPWKQYNTGWVSSLNDLTMANHTIGVWVNVTSVGDGFINITGLVADSTSIPLRTGWNLVGYPSLCTNMSVADALWGTGAIMVEVFDPNATYKTKVVGPTYLMKPGEGYWVYVPAASTWTVGW